MKLIGVVFVPMVLAAACSDDGTAGAADAAVDAPTEFVTVTVEAQRLPRPGVHVYTSDEDGTRIAVATTDANGMAALPVGASVTAMDPGDSLTEMVGDRRAITLTLGLGTPDRTTYTLDFTPQPGATSLTMRTPCGARAQVQPQVPTVSVEACGRTTKLALVTSTAVGDHYIAVAEVPPSGSVPFGSWGPVPAVPVTVTPPDGWGDHVFYLSYPDPDFQVELSGGLAEGMPGVIEVDFDSFGEGLMGASYQRRFETPPAELTVQPADLPPPLNVHTVGTATDARGVGIVVPDGGYDRCTMLIRTVNLYSWRVRSGPLAPGAQMLVIPHDYDGFAIAPEPRMDVTCVTNLGFANPSEPVRYSTQSVTF